MSTSDLNFIRELSISGSDVARILQISRQSVSCGLRGDGDYFSPEKLRRISEDVQKVFDVDADHIARLIYKFYPQWVDDISRIALTENINIAIDGDMYVCCNKIAYYMSVYKRLFLELREFIRVSRDVKFYFAFPDAATLNHNRSKIIALVGDEKAAKSSYIIVCPTIEVFPFSVSGREKGKHAVYFCEDEGFVRQNENNSKWIVTYIRKYIDTHQGLLRRLKSP